MRPAEEIPANERVAMLTIREASQRLHVSPSLIYGLCARGMLEHFRCGLGRGTIRISEKALEAYLERSKVTGRLRPEGSRGKEQLFKHLDAQRVLTAWKQQGVL
jgi:excisionase family DNA binding protein